MSQSTEWEVVAAEGFRFFGSVSASVSHEIRNRLAVINEKAGLIGDLAEVAARKGTVDPERLRLQAEKIKNQILLANQIVGNLNQFAHSVDEKFVEIDLREIVDLVVRLCERRAAMKNVILKVSPSDRSEMVVTNPFLLECVISGCIDFALSNFGEDRVVGITIRRSGVVRQVQFGGLQQFERDSTGLPGGLRVIHEVLKGFGGQLRFPTSDSGLVLELPAQEHLGKGEIDE